MTTLEHTLEDLEKAIIFATKMHSGQVRKGDGRLYIMHPMSVMNKLYKYKGDSINIILLAICSILNDVCEDCDVTLDVIGNLFGNDVSEIVSDLTSDKEAIKTIGKTEYLCKKMTKISSYALIIKLCDRLDNVCDVNSMSQEFIHKYYKQTSDILDYIVLNRELTKTHNSIIADILKQVF